jgi:hypothetical protein
VATLLPARHFLPGGIEAVFPVWLAANLDEDVSAYEVGYGITKAALRIKIVTTFSIVCIFFVGCCDGAECWRILW